MSQLSTCLGPRQTFPRLQKNLPVNPPSGGRQELDKDPASRSRRPPEASRATVAAIRGRIKKVVHVVEPSAQIILYGSRARGDAQPDSDWDLLILLDGVVDLARERSVWHRLYPLELDLEEVLCPVVLSRQDWSSELYRAMPFHRNVDRDGIVL